MKKITFKLFALMLACFLVLPLMFACGEQGGSSEGTEASQSTSTTDSSSDELSKDPENSQGSQGGTQPPQGSASSTQAPSSETTQGSETTQSSGATPGTQSSTTDSSKKDPDTQDSITNDPVQDPEKSFDELSEKEKAFYILNIAPNEDRILFDMAMTLKCDYMGYTIEAEITGDTIIIYEDGKYTEYNVMKMTMTMAGQSTVQTIITGYMDGKHFNKQIADGSVQLAQCESMTQEEYLEMLAEEKKDEPEHYGITEENCDTATCTKNKFGNWVAIFTDIDKYGLLYFEKLITDNFQNMITNELEDVTLTLTTTSDFLPVSEEVVFHFFGENPPTLTIEGTFDYGEEVSTPTIDWSEYEDVSNGNTDNPETNI